MKNSNAYKCRYLLLIPLLLSLSACQLFPFAQKNNQNLTIQPHSTISESTTSQPDSLDELVNSLLSQVDRENTLHLPDCPTWQNTFSSYALCRYIAEQSPGADKTLFLLQSALQFYHQHSNSNALIAQRQAETIATERQAFPDIQPTASVQRKGSPQVGLEMQYTLIDFGLNQAQVKDRKIETQKALLQKYQDQTQQVVDTLARIATIAELKARISLTEQTLSDIQRLFELAQHRQQYGVDGASDEMLLSIKVAELTSEIDTHQKSLALELALLNEQMSQPAALSDIPSLDELLAMITPAHIILEKVPQLQQANFRVQQAQEAVDIQQKSLYPKLVAHAGTYYDRHGERDNQLGLSLRASTGIFSGSSQIKALQSALVATQQEREKLALDIQIDLQRLDLEEERLQQNLLIIEQLLAQTQQTIDLFLSRFQAGKVIISDGITPYNTLLRSLIEQNNIKQELLIIKTRRFPFLPLN